MRRWRRRQPGTAHSVENWNRENLAWLAGLVEGEGCIGIRRSRLEDLETGFLRLAMSDEDVVRRAHSVAGFGTVRYWHPPSKKESKPMWVWHVGAQPQVYALLVALFPWLGERRRAKAVEAIKAVLA